LDCQGTVELLMEALEHDLSAKELEGVTEHLSTCEACRAVRQRFDRLRSAGAAAALERDEREELVAQARSRSGLHVVPADGVGVPGGDAQPAGRPVADADTPTIPGYEIIETIGSGAMGTVYKAHQVSMDRAVALKVVSPELSEDDDFMKRFLREARVSGRLNHPNVVGVIDAGLEGGTYFLTMEYVEGRSVKDMVEADGALAEKRAVDICLQVARALEHASAHKLIHRDVKPENILVTPEGVAKLCDLGLSKTPADAGITHSGMIVGTPFYIAPEQARGAMDLDSRADVYSLGCSLYHMVIGRVPFDGGTAAIVIKQHLDAPFPDPRKIVPGLSAGLASILQHMVEKDRDDRYPSPTELREDLQALAEGRYRGRAEVFREKVKPGRKAAVRRKSSVQLKRVRGGRGARRSAGGGLVVLLAGLPVAAAAVIFLLSSGRRPQGTGNHRGLDGAAGPQVGSTPRSEGRGPERPDWVDDAVPTTPQAEAPAASSAEDFVSRARARADELVRHGQYGRALEDGGPIDGKLAPPASRREIAELRREVYAKANAELKRRIDKSTDPVLEFDLITEGMPKSLVDEAGKKLGVEEADGK
jgi:serine/threonine-protein kinase